MTSQNLHHFTIYVGDFDSAISEIAKICREVLNFELEGNPNYFLHKFGDFLIDDARLFSETKNRKIKAGDSAVSVISFGGTNIESQNALLKLFEEPIPGHYFFLVVPKIHILLPTILSRAVVIENFTKRETDDRVAEIFKMSLKKRMEYVADIVDQVKKEKLSRSDLRNLADKIMIELNQKFLAGNSELAEPLKHLNKITQYLENPGASLKNILEYMMLLIPKSDIIGR